MAGDVHAALLKVIANEGYLSSQEAEVYINKLEETSRYQRDVWVT
jgi:sulfite reductase (NADPH) flavoprotein alpha-component